MMLGSSVGEFLGAPVGQTLGETLRAPNRLGDPVNGMLGTLAVKSLELSLDHQ